MLDPLLRHAENLDRYTELRSHANLNTRLVRLVMRKGAIIENARSEKRGVSARCYRGGPFGLAIAPRTGPGQHAGHGTGLSGRGSRAFPAASGSARHLHLRGPPPLVREHRWGAPAGAPGGHRFGTMFGAKDGTRSTSFNYTCASAWKPFERLVKVGAVESLIAETLRSFDSRPVPEKFIGDIIVTPSCAASIAGTLARAFDGYALMGGLTPYAGREGQTIANPAFSLLNRPADARFPDGADFDDCGVATRNVDVIRNGTLETFLVDFFCSRKLGRRQNAGRHNLVIPPGERGIDDLIRETERGIVLARFSGRVPNH